MKSKVLAVKIALGVLNDMENKILNSDEYIGLKEVIRVEQERLEKLTKPIQEASFIVQTTQNDLLEWAKENEQFETDDFSVKFREKKEVNKEKLFGILEDTDLFVSLATISQKVLKDYAKENKDLKKPLENCIEVTEKTPVSVSLNEN